VKKNQWKITQITLLGSLNLSPGNFSFKYFRGATILNYHN